MNTTQAERLLAEVQATWPQRTLDEPQVLVWNESLAVLDYDIALVAVKRLRSESEWLPSHAKFLAAVEEERKKAYGQRALPRPTGPCARCDDTGMVLHERSNAAYPCRDCRPVEFVRWAEGQFMSAHVNGPCADCTTFRYGSPKEVRELADEYRSRVAQAGAIDHTGSSHRHEPGRGRPTATPDRVAELRRTLSSGVVRRVPDPDEDF